MSDLTPHARSNERYWTGQAPDYAPRARRHWAEDEPHWGIYEIPEAEIRALPDVDGLDGVELGCGTAYWSAWLTRRGARMVGIDITEAQLATARELQAEHGLEFPLIRASAESVPLPDASFDLAFSEYGASLWCDPDLWIAEAERLLRPGGRLVFLTNTPLLMLCTPTSGERASERLVRDQFGMRRFEWPGEEGVEFHLAHGEMIRVLAEHGFAVEALHELRRPEGAEDTHYDFVTPEWSRRWPCEEIWRARLV
jgi:SAM-dependent methyltransferase